MYQIKKIPSDPQFNLIIKRLNELIDRVNFLSKIEHTRTMPTDDRPGFVESMGGDEKDE